MTKVNRYCCCCCVVAVFCASTTAQDVGFFWAPSRADPAKFGGGSLVDANAMPLPTGTAMRDLELVAGRVVVVALFTGFSGSSGDNIGMEEIRTQLLAQSDANVKIVAERFGHSQQRKAVRFITSNADADAEIVLIGHSFGADSTIEVAERLGDRQPAVTVDRIVQIDSVGFGDSRLPENVTTGLNYFQEATGFFEPEGEQPVEGSTNVDGELHLPPDDGETEINHTNIDNNDVLQAEVVDFAVNGVLPTGDGVTPPNSPRRSIRIVTIVGPLEIDALPGLTSGAFWESGLIQLATPISLSGNDGVIIDVAFGDRLLQMSDATGSSLETLTVELFGAVVVADQGDSDVVKVEFQFDDIPEELVAAQAFGPLSISSSSGTGILQETVDLTGAEFLFGGFTLEVLQNGAGLVEINGFRVSLLADAIVGPPPIPTLSQWGMVTMMLLVLTAGTLVYARRRPIHA